MENTVIPAGTVVVGLDGSPSSEQALDWAIDLARRERRQLTLAHGLEPMHEQTEALEILERARARCHDLAPDLSVHTALWKADPRVVLRDLGEGAAAVVVGSHGRGPVASRLLGSVGLSVTRRAPCPVVVVRPHHPGAVRNGVLVLADERSRPAVEHAYRQASLRDLPLTILSVADDGLAVAEAVAGLAEKFPDVRSRTLVGDPAHESARMDLVVVGVAHAGVVERADCPVAVVPVGVAGSSA
jgi:nucleotide-binding universal stress UspA family protein